MEERSLQGRLALVTGASSGLGVDFARELAARGCNLILVARREERLRAVQQTIRTSHDVEVAVIAMDLAMPDAPQQLYQRIQARGDPVDVLVNNAGFGIYGEFVEIEWEREAQMLQLDIVTVVHLTKLFVRGMVARNFGHILQVASIGAYQPSPLYASYSAAKSFVLNFSEALNYELRGTNVNVTTISPGITRTEFLQVSGQEPTRYQRLSMMESEEVARIGIQALLKGRSSVVPGLWNAMMAWFATILPHRVTTALAYRLMDS